MVFGMYLLNWTEPSMASQSNDLMSDILLPFNEVTAQLSSILSARGFKAEKAQRCAYLFARADLDGVRSHGLNRFLLFLEFIRRGYVKPDAEPIRLDKRAMFERWDGQLGPGNLNAEFAMGRAIRLSAEFGMGCVALSRTNHWMRGGNFGWQAAESGCIGICFTNTKPNMPAWGGSEPKLGNNPLVMAIPRKKGHVVLDMALSQFAYGKLTLYKEKGESAPFDAGFDKDGELTKSPEMILKNHLSLPIGLWKGSGLSLMLDMLASLLSGGDAAYQVARSGDEIGLSQVFLCLDPEKLGLNEWMETKADAILDDLKASTVFEGKTVRYPGENTQEIRMRNSEHGIPVGKALWEKILKESQK